MAMDSFAGKLAVITGGGSGMGRELTRQLAGHGCSVAACDLNPGSVAETAAIAGAEAPPGVLVTAHACDVAKEDQVLRFRDELLAQHASDHVDLAFSNAGAGGGESFVASPREVWERIFAIDWWGVYYCARAFLPLLIASGDGVLVNTSSVNGLWASLGPGMPQTAYSSAKFAVRGFTEALVEDLRTNAPSVRAVLVLPGHVGTSIVANSLIAQGLPAPERLTDAQAEELVPARVRDALTGAGLLPAGAAAGDLRDFLVRVNADFRDKAPVTAAQAATIILDGVRAGAWRILIGEDARMIDAAVRAKPEAAYDYAELFAGLPLSVAAGYSGSTSSIHPARHLLRAKDLADGRYFEPLRVAALAAAAGLSPAHFSRSAGRSARARTGTCSPGGWSGPPPCSATPTAR